MVSLFIAELKLQGKHWGWIAAMMLSFIFGAFVINKQTPDMDIQISGVYFLIKTFALQLLILPVIVAIFSAQASIRDFDSKMTTVVYACSSNLHQLFFARLSVLILLVCLLYVSFACGIIAGVSTHNAFSMVLAIGALTWGGVILALPSILLFATVLFVVGLQTKRSVYLYLVACCLFFTYQFFLSVNGSPLMASRVVPEPSFSKLYAYIDPLGLSAFFEQVKFWLPEVKNVQLPAVDMPLLFNRVVMLLLTIAVALVGINHHVKHFSIEQVEDEKTSTPRWLTKFTRSLAAVFSNNLTKLKLTHSRQHIINAGQYSRLLAIAYKEWQLTINTKMFVAMCGALLVVTVTEIYSGYMYLESLGTTPIASTMITINRFIGDVLPRFGALFTLLIAAELCWRDSQTHFKPLIDSTSVSNDELFFGRLMALCFVPVCFVTVTVVAACIMQITHSGSIDKGTYVALYVYNAVPMIWLAAVCVVVHSLMSNKYSALFVTFLVFLVTETSLLSSLGLQHPLWTLGKLPQLSYSEVAGFGGALDSFYGYLSLRFSLLILLILLALRGFRRGEEMAPSFSQLTRFRWQQHESVIASLGFIALLLSTMQVIGYTWYEGNYQSTQSKQAWKAQYEKKFIYASDMASLSVDVVNTEVRLIPDERRVVINGHYQLKNRTHLPISQMIVSTPKPFIYQDVVMENAQLLAFDEKFQTRSYAFNQPIQPGESVSFSFTAFFQQNSYLGIPADNYLTEAYSYLRYIRYLPVFGYVKHYQLKDNNLRADYGLPAIKPLSLEEELAQYQGDMTTQYDWATLNTTIITPLDYVAFAPGTLVKKEQRDEQLVFQYKTEHAIRNIGHVIASKLPHKSQHIAGVNVDVYYPEGKEIYAQKHLTAIADAIHYGNAHFGKTTLDNLRLLPALSFFPSTGYAMPQTIFIGEAVGFHVDLNNAAGFDHLYRRTVHEVAHQWWGHGVNGAPIEGEAVLIETLAKYTEMMLLKQKYGHEYVKQLIAYEQQRYFSGRARSSQSELPLYRADDNHLVYSKGAAAMYALTQQLGEEAVNRALATLVEHHSYPNKPATTLDLLAYLQHGQPAEKVNLINDWFKNIVIHDVMFTRVNLVAQPAGFNIEACVTDNKSAITDVTVDVSDKQGNLLKRNVLKAKPHDGEEFCQNIFVSQRPSSLMIDSELLLLDSNRENNLWLVD